MNPLIIKLGGVLLDSEEALERLFTALDSYRQQHQRPLVIVHGGGCVVDELMKQLSLPVVKKNGLRVTPADQIDIITGALAGTANKTLLAWAIKHQINAVGLSLADGGSAVVTPLDPALGHVGNAQPGSPALLNTLLSAGYLPVVSSIGITAEGQLMNVNADQAATALAATLGADLILLSDVSGILDGKATHCGNDGAKSGTTDRARHHHRWYGGEGECGARRGPHPRPPGGYRQLAPCRSASCFV